MSGGFPIVGGAASYQTSGSIIANNANVSANTLGTWTTIIASTSADAARIVVTTVCGGASGGAGTLVDIGIGGAGSETVLIPQLLNNGFQPIGLAGAYYANFYDFPISIPAGTRLASRCQNSVGSGAIGTFTIINLYDGSFQQSTGGRVDAVGAVTATSYGTAVTPGNGSYGSYAVLAASSANDYIGFALGFSHNGNAGAGTDTLVDIAVGGSGSEKVLMTTCFRWDSAVGAPLPNTTPFMPFSIPAGTRIAARGKSDGATSAFGVVLYGVR